MKLEDHVAALAALGTEHDDDVAAATRLRIRTSLERGHAWRRHASTLAALAILLVASGAWALATGRLQRWVGSTHAVPAPRPVSTVAPAIPRAPMVARTPVVAPSIPPAQIVAAPAPAAIAQPAPIVAAAPATPAAPAHVEIGSSAPVAATRRVSNGASAHLLTTRAPSESSAVETASADDALYTHAHDLHFHGGAPADTLAAWDAYLAAAPHGAFAIEAQYNRALCLVRLGRLADARTALEPFARGAIEPAGYRQSDAAHLIERIDHRLNGTR